MTSRPVTVPGGHGPVTVPGGHGPVTVPGGHGPVTVPGGSYRVAAVGGGHGLAATLRAVRRYTDQVTAIVSVADDGGSSRPAPRAAAHHPPG